jgi:hypothetical protein
MKVTSPSVLTAISNFPATALGAPVVAGAGGAALATLDLGLLVPGQLVLVQAGWNITKDATPGSVTTRIGQQSGTGTLVPLALGVTGTDSIKACLAAEQWQDSQFSIWRCTAAGTMVLNFTGISSAGNATFAIVGTYLGAIKFNR